MADKPGVAQNRTGNLRTTLYMGKQAQIHNLQGGMPESQELGYKSLYTSMVTKDPLVRLLSYRARASGAPSPAPPRGGVPHGTQSAGAKAFGSDGRKASKVYAEWTAVGPGPLAKASPGVY